MNKKGISLPMLIALVISSSIGAAIFTFSNNLANIATPFTILIAWLIVGIGVLALALSFSNLLNKRPDLEGIFAYATEGFGTFAGFLSGWGYWMSAWLGNVALATVMTSSIGYFIPIFKGGQNVWSILLASIIAWLLTYFVSRGVESATMINALVTVCKLIPLFVFIVIATILFNAELFTNQFFGNLKSNLEFKLIWPQVKQCVMVMMWSFVGIEGAVMMSSRAKVKKDASKATIIGVVMLIFLYVVVSLLPYGYFNQEQLSQMTQPALVYIFKEMVGPVGGAFISLGLIISILGAWLSWTMLPAETVLLMSKEKLLPKYFSYKNKKNAPYIALFVTQGLIQMFLCTLLFTDQAYNLAASLCTASIVISYGFVAAYQIKYSWQKIYEKGAKYQLMVGIVALIFQIGVVILAGLNYLVLAMIAYVPGLIFYWLTDKRFNRSKWYEIIITIVILLIAFISVFWLIWLKK